MVHSIVFRIFPLSVLRPRSPLRKGPPLPIYSYVLSMAFEFDPGKSTTTLDYHCAVREYLAEPLSFFIHLPHWDRVIIFDLLFSLKILFHFSSLAFLCGREARSNLFGRYYSPSSYNLLGPNWIYWQVLP